MPYRNVSIGRVFLLYETANDSVRYCILQMFYHNMDTGMASLLCEYLHVIVGSLVGKIPYYSIDKCIASLQNLEISFHVSAHLS